MSTIRIKPQQHATALRRENERVRKAIRTASYAAAMRFSAHLVNETDARGITDRGAFKNAWRAERTLDGGATVTNDAPYAGILELGCRPHPVSKLAREHIAAWAVRKLGLSQEAAERASWGIAHKIAREGQKPTYMVRDSLPMAAKFFALEMVRVLNATRASK
jgi:hypothetical protein